MKKKKRKSFLVLKSLSEYTDKQPWQVHFITDALKIASLITALSRLNWVPTFTRADKAYGGKKAPGGWTHRSAPSLGAKLTSRLWALAMTSFSLFCAKDKDISDCRMRLRAPNPEMQAVQVIRCQFSQDQWQSASRLQCLWQGGKCRCSLSLTTQCL